MNPDFIGFAAIGAIVVVAYFIGRWHGRQAEKASAASLGVADKPSTSVVGPWRPKK